MKAWLLIELEENGNGKHDLFAELNERTIKIGEAELGEDWNGTIH